MQCPNCEAENRDEAKFCDECGFPLSGSIARVAGAASPKGPSTRDPYRRQRVERFPADGEGEDPEPVAPLAIDDPLEPDAIDDFDPFEPSDATEYPVDDGGRAYGTPPYFDLPMSDNDYEAQSWQYEQGSTQSLDPRQEGAFGYGGEAAQPGADQPDQDEWQGEFTMEMPRVEARERAPRARDFRVAASRPDRSGGKLAAFIVAGVAVGAIIAALVTFALGLWGGTAVPDVTGMTEADATSTLNEAGFSVRTTQVKSDDTEGLVLIMDPGAGSRAPEGSEVIIHIATARFVPDIVGKNAEEAKALLTEAGYTNVRYEMQKSDESENVVLDVSPQGGTRAKSSAEVVVKVSEAYRVPNVSGLDVDSAIDTVSDSGLTPEVVYIDTDQFPDGTIIGTNPEAGTQVTQGASVSISVARARGVELVSLTEQLFSQGSTVTVGGVDYEIESVISVSYQGDDTVAFTATGRPKITFFGETLYASASQTISGQVVWSGDNEVISIY